MYLESARSEKMKNIFLRKRLTIVDRFEGLWSLRTRFSPLAPVVGPERKNWLRHPLPLFMAVSMILNTRRGDRCKYGRRS